MSELTFLERCLKEETIEMYDVGRYTVHPSFMIIVQSIQSTFDFTQILTIEDFYHGIEPICIDQQLNVYPFNENTAIILKHQPI